MRRTGLIALAAWLAALPALAQGVVGRSMIEGRAVILYDDNSWAFDEAEAGGCRAVATGFRFCGSPAIWKPMTGIDPELTAQYRYNDRTYALFVHEGLGRRDGMSEALLRSVIIGNAANGAGVRPEDIVVLEPRTSLIDGQEATQLTYLVTISGLDLVFRNSFLVGDRISLQAATYSVAAQDDPAFQALHDEFLKLIELDEPQ